MVRDRGQDAPVGEDQYDAPPVILGIWLQLSDGTYRQQTDASVSWTGKDMAPNILLRAAAGPYLVQILVPDNGTDENEAFHGLEVI